MSLVHMAPLLRRYGHQFLRNETNLRLFTSSAAASSATTTTPTTANDVYQRALQALDNVEKHQLAKQEERSKQLFQAFERKKSAKGNAVSAGVAIVKTIAKQTRQAQQQEQQELVLLQQEAKSLLEQAGLVHGHSEALVRLGNLALEAAKKQDATTTHNAEQQVGKLVHQALDYYEMADSSQGWFNRGQLLWTGYPNQEEQADDDTVIIDNIILRRDVQASLESFEKAIDEGDADAMYFVGVYNLANGDDDTSPNNNDDLVKDQWSMGLDLIQQAADAGHAGALHYLALFYYNGNEALGIAPYSAREFVQRLDAAAEAGDAEALFLRGHGYFHGNDGREKDLGLAFQDFCAAADAGNADAAVSAGAMLHQGIGVAQDQQKAFELYQLAGELGSVEGWRNVVACYALGEGVKECKDTAKYIADTMLKDNADKQR